MMGPAESEAKAMAAVLSSVMPKGFRCRFMQEKFSPVAGVSGLIKSGLHVERFDGAFWYWIATLASGDAPDAESSAEKAIKAYSEKKGWAKTVMLRAGGFVLKCPPAGSVEELRLKLGLMDLRKETRTSRPAQAKSVSPCEGAGRLGGNARPFST